MPHIISEHIIYEKTHIHERHGALRINCIPSLADFGLFVLMVGLPELGATGTRRISGVVLDEIIPKLSNLLMSE